MPIRFLTPNLADDADVSVLGAAAGYPALNVQNPNLWRRWRTGLTGIVLDDCEAVTGWVAVNAPNETLDNANFTEGANSLNLGKSGGATEGAYLKTLDDPLDLTGMRAGPDIYVKDKSEFVKLTMRMGENSGKYFAHEFDAAEFSDLDADGDPWNSIVDMSDDILSEWPIVVGAPGIAAIQWLRASIFTVGAGDTVALGNIKMDFWRGAAFDETVTFDLTTAQAVTAAVIDGHDFDGTESDIVLQRSADAVAWTTEATFTYNAGTMVAFITSATYQYWRIKFTKVAPDDIRNIGRVFLGTYQQPDRGLNMSWRRERSDLSRVARSISGAVYGDKRVKFWEAFFSLNHEPLSSISGLRTALKELGISNDLFVCFDTSSPNGDNTIYGRFTKPWNEIEPQNDFYLVDFSFAEEVG